MIDKIHNVGTQGAIWATMGVEAVNVLYDLRWMLVLSLMLVLADFWWGYSESRYHRMEALRVGDKMTADKFRFRFSRAGRRSMNKLIDYLTYLLIGSIMGVGIFEPLGICSHVITAAVGIGLGCIFDLSSIVGHVCVVHGIEPPKWTVKGMVWFLAHVTASFIKKKNPDAGEAIEETIEKYDKDNKNEDTDNKEIQES